MDRTAELLRRVGAQANARCSSRSRTRRRFLRVQPGAERAERGWRVRHLTAVVRLYVDHGFGAGGPTFADYTTELDAFDCDRVLGELAHAQGNFLATLVGLDDDDLDGPCSTHWGGQLPAWQVVWTVVVEQFHHGPEVGALLDIRRGAPRRDALFPELQDGRSLT